MNRPVDFTSTTKVAPLCCAEISRASITPTLSAKISSPSLSTTPQRSPSPSKPSATSALCAQHRVAHGVQHLHVFGVGIVVREGVIELAVERHDLAADRLQHLRRERAGGAVAAGADDLELALELRPVGEVGDVARGKILDEVRRSRRRACRSARSSTISLSRVISSGPEGERAVGAHLHAGPAVVVVRGRHHRDARHVELELREIGHRRHREPDVVHLAARRHQAARPARSSPRPNSRGSRGR